jgi:hypothetical protein
LPRLWLFIAAALLATPASAQGGDKLILRLVYRPELDSINPPVETCRRRFDKPYSGMSALTILCGTQDEIRKAGERASILASGGFDD